MTDDCISLEDQPQNQVDHYEKAKDMVDQFQVKMHKLNQN